MRGGPRIFNSPYFTGALTVILIILGFSYWSTNSQNKFLTAKIEELQQDLKLEAKLVQDTEARAAKFQMHLNEETDTLKNDLADCKKKFDLLEKENVYQVGQINELENSKNQLIKDVEELKIDTQETKLQEENLRLAQTVDELEGKISNLETKLEDEVSKSKDLQGKLAEIFETNPHVAAQYRQQRGGDSPDLGPGQLPDVNPAAVHIVKKDSLGPNGSGLQIYPAHAVNNLANYGPIPPPNMAKVSPLPQAEQGAGIGLANIRRGISSTSPIPPNNKSQENNNQIPLPNKPHEEIEDLNKNENISIVDEHGDGPIIQDNSIADEENVEKILDAQIQSKEVERRQIEQENKVEEEYVGSKKVKDKDMQFLDPAKIPKPSDQLNEKADSKNVGDTQIEEIIDEENVPKIMEAQIQSKELQIQSGVDTDKLKEDGDAQVEKDAEDDDQSPDGQISQEKDDVDNMKVAHVKAEKEGIIDNINEEKALDNDVNNNDIVGGPVDFNGKSPNVIQI